MAVGWLAAYRQGAGSDASSELAAAVSALAHDLGSVAGPIALAAATAVLGAVSIQIFCAPALWVANLVSLVVASVERGFVFVLDKLRGSSTVRRFRNWESVPVDPARRFLRRLPPELRQATISSHKGDDPAGDEEVYDVVDLCICNVLENPEHDHPYVRWLDRQAAARLGIVFPLLALTAQLANKFALGYGAFGIAPLVIAFQGADLRNRRDVELERLVHEQLLRGNAES